jgi:pectate lyase
VLHQRYVGDFARAAIGPPTADQVVQARIRPVQFEGADRWAGLMARYVDDRNNLYVTLRQSGAVSLWRRTNNTATQLATAPLPVTEGTWYDVRLEIVNNHTRVFVDNRLMLSTSADPGPRVPSGTQAKGRVGVITYRTYADFDEFRAYQP